MPGGNQQFLAAHFKRPRLLKWKDTQPNSGHPLSHEFGADFTVYQPMFATSCRAAFIQLGPGKTWPSHSYANEHILVAVQGLLQVVVEETTYDLVPYDMLFIPAGGVYSIGNVSQHQAMCLSLHLRALDDWPAGQSVFPPYDEPPDRDSEAVTS